MSASKKYPLKSIAAALVSLVVLAWFLHENSQYAAIAKFPIEGASSKKTSPVFIARKSATYHIYLETDRTLPNDPNNKSRLPCLLGMQEESAECANAGRAIEITWEVAHEGNKVTAGESGTFHDAAWGKDKLEKLVGTASLKENTSYQLILNLGRDIAEINAANPRIVVRLDPYAAKNQGILLSVGALLAVITAILSIIGFITWGIKTSRN